MENKKLVSITQKDCDLCALSVVCGAYLLFKENLNLKEMVFEGDCARAWSDLVYVEGSSQKKPALNPTL